MTTQEERELCHRYGARIRGYGLRHLRNAAAAEDLVQHVLLAVLVAVRAGEIQTPERLGAYVFGACRYAVRDMQRGELRQRKIAEQHAATLPEGYWPQWDGVDRTRVELCLLELEARERAVILATFAYDRDTEEIGRDLSLTAGNVRVIRHRALARLQACVGGEP
ncbi:MAG: sigma-70 family RNA polymerase sigma factor [Polyangiaceae bacterium]|nr:sigma-70 family RNA polymerase sigma factor [Polyangiaceae bacterium]